MTKKEIIDKLKNSKSESGVAVITCNVTSPSNRKSYTGQDILVVVDKYQYALNDDKIQNSLHWWIFNSIGDFVRNTIMLSQNVSANDSLRLDKTYINEFLSIGDFTSDFA